MSSRTEAKRPPRGLFATFLFVSVLLSACRPAPAPGVVLAGRTMGTSYSVKLAGKAAALSEAERVELHRGIDALLARIDGRMSTYKPDSELSRFNAYRGSAWFPVSRETAEVVLAALRTARETEGAFDPTVGPLVDLWGFGPKARPEKSPSAADIAAAREAVGWERLHARLDPPALRKEVPALRVDLSAIAKGYGVDAVSSLLLQRGHTAHMVEIGGEVVARGLNARLEPWRIGVDKPADHAAPGRELSAVVPLADRALATSGNYRNFFVEGGKRYSHFIDPRAGRPVTHFLASASVLAPTCMEADAAATAVMVLGPEKGLAYVEKNPSWEALLIVGDAEGRLSARKTPGFPDSAP